MTDLSSSLFTDRSHSPGKTENAPSQPSDGSNLAPHPLHRRATTMLLVATSLWGISFPLTKALAQAQHGLLPHASSWFFAALALTVRFGLAAVVMAAFTGKALRAMTAREFWQGFGLGIFAFGGMILQLDGLSHTLASTSAFLTSTYCVMIPVFVALQRQRWPSWLVVASCALVAVGMALLAGVDWRTFRLGRGEGETLLSSVFFAGQILWLERPRYARNRTLHATVVMFVTLALSALPMMFLTARHPADIGVAALGSGMVIGLLAALTLFCTLISFTMMNHWQRHLEATEAGLIYCAEPVWTSVFALFLPAWLSAWGGIEYPNETATVRLLIGGALITAANVCIQLQPKAVTPIR